MTDKLKQIIQEELTRQPKEIQEAVNAFDWVKITEEIGKKYLLTESELNDFQVETLLILVSLESAESYARNIENNVGTSKDEAVKIANEAFQKIFTPISNSIEEAVKNNLKNKNPNPTQTLDFILSGGDYSAFIAPARENSPLEEYPLGGGGESTPSLKRATPQEGNKKEPAPPSLADIKANVQKANVPTSAAKMEDMKRKFTI